MDRYGSIITTAGYAEIAITQSNYICDLGIKMEHYSVISSRTEILAIPCKTLINHSKTHT